MSEITTPLRVGCCAYSYRDFLTGKREPAMTLDDFLERMAEFGIDGVELTSYYFPTPITAAGLHRVARHCFRLGLDLNATAVGNTFALPPGEERDRQIALVKTWIDRSVDLGSPCLRVFAGSAPKGTTEDEAAGWVIECLKTCCVYAAEKGVILALENHHGVVATADRMLAILDAVSSEWLGMKWDAGNFHSADPYGDLARCAPYAVTTHLKTEIYPNGKSEEPDLARLVRILRDANYRGYLHLEYEAAEDPLVAVPRTLKKLQQLAL